MTETRIAPRYHFDKRAIAEYGGDKYPCTVRDISITGAAIEFPDPSASFLLQKISTWSSRMMAWSLRAA
jgi:hypothetical protein